MDTVFYLLWYVLLLLVATELYRVFGATVFTLALVAAILVYVICYHGFYWTIPRRRRHTPGLILCFLGSFLFSLAVRDSIAQANLEGLTRVIAALWQQPGLYVAALAGAFIFFYIGVKLGTPQCCTMVVSCTDVSNPPGGDHRDRLITHMKKPNTGIWKLLEHLIYHRGRKDLEFDAKELIGPVPPGPKGPPWVWPYEYVVGREGSLIWHVYGEETTSVEITFENTKHRGSYNLFDLLMGARTRKYNPFHPTAPTVLRGTIPPPIQQPLVLSAGPAVVSGRGSYTVWIKDSRGEHLVDPGGSGPKKD